jgi:hypothetical protein
VNDVTNNLNFVTKKVFLQRTFCLQKINNNKMKKIIFLVFVALFSLSTSMVFAKSPDSNSEAEKTAVPVKTESKLSDEEIDRITKRVEEIRKMDKSDLTSEEKSELKTEMKEMKKEVKKAGGSVYIGSVSLVLIIILVIILL